VALHDYDYNFVKALFALFPEIGLEESKFAATISISLFLSFTLYHSLSRWPFKIAYRYYENIKFYLNE